MRIDIVVPNQGADAVKAIRAGPLLEKMGFAGLWLTDHVIGADEYRHYGGQWMEILSALAFLASSTSRVRLGTGILVLPYRNPVLTAKMIATIDQLSGGRVDLGVGTGYARTEFEALGVGPLHEERGRVTDECLDVIKKCWAGGAVAASGSRFSFDAVEFSPQPAQNPSVPIWVGSRGVGRLPLRRAAQYGDYWHPVRVTPEELIDASNFIDDLAGRRVRRSARLVFGQAKPTEAVVEAIESYRAAGCEQVAIDFRCESLSIYLKLAEQLSMRLMLV